MFSKLFKLSGDVFGSLSFNNLNLNSRYASTFVIMSIISLIWLLLFIRNFKNDIRSIHTVNFMSLSAFFALFSICMLIDFEKLYNDNFVSICNTIVIMLYLPILIFLCVILIANIVQIFRFGFSRANKVSISITLIFMVMEHLLYDMALGQDTLLFIIVSELLGGILLYFLSIFLGTLLSTIVFLIVPPKYDKDFIIILGCRCKKDNKPSDFLKNRIDAAIGFYHRQILKTGKKAKFIVTGTVSTKGCLSEADIMKNYLEQNGIDTGNIILEQCAKNTFQNMKFCKDIIDKINKSAKSVFVTNDFHIFRSSILADINELKCVSLNSGTTNLYHSLSCFFIESKGVFDAYKKYHVYACYAVILVSFITAIIYKANLSDIILNYY